jgi:hypothetical protein
VSILMAVQGVDGRGRGMVPASKVSMMIMRPPQQGQGQASAFAGAGSVKEVAAITRPGVWRVSKNLYVQVGPAGTKSWLFRYMRDGRSHGMGLGSLELVTLAKAREKALLCRTMLFDGLDPLEERRSRRTQALLTTTSRITFRTCAQRYIEAHAPGWKNSKHRRQWRNTLETYAYPVIGDLPVTVVDTSLVLEVIQPIWTTRPRRPPGSAAGSRAFSTGRQCTATGRARTRPAGAAISTSCCRPGPR